MARVAHANARLTPAERRPTASWTTAGPCSGPPQLLSTTSALCARGGPPLTSIPYRIPARAGALCLGRNPGVHPGSAEHGTRNTGTATLRFHYVLAADAFSDAIYHFTGNGLST